MKTDSIFFSSQAPSLFQIAALFEDFFPDGSWKSSAASVSHLPIAEFMLNPEKMITLLRSGKPDSRGANPISGKNPAPKRAARNGSSRKPAGIPKDNGHSPAPLRKVQFTLHSPSASSVKLAGDFSEWEKRAVEMMHSQEGIWFTVVPLPPGSYSYRYIVDGQWCDDPGSDRRIRNPFGTENAVVHVT
jgi:5'-AMP-activated protein kinase regulatory beta subunit